MMCNGRFKTASARSHPNYVSLLTCHCWASRAAIAAEVSSKIYNCNSSGSSKDLYREIMDECHTSEAKEPSGRQQ